MEDYLLVEQVVNYFNANRSTVRETAKKFRIPKSSVYNYLKRKPNKKTEEILAFNKAIAHIRGGQATKNKYMKKRS